MATASSTTHTTGGKPKVDPPCLAEALRLLTLGFWPVAITPPDSGRPAAGKAPIGKAWGVTRPTEASLRATWAKNPGASVGLKLGPEGGLIDVEVDDPEIGPEALAGLLGGECVESLGWDSARGSHVLFRWDARLEAFPKSIYKLPKFPGVEIRLGNGEKQLQSVCPPSPTTRDDGKGTIVSIGRRQWNECDAVAPIPATLIRALEEAIAEPKTEPPPKASPTESPFNVTATGGNRPDAETRAIKYLEKCGPAISKQRGHDQAFKTACNVGPGFDLDPAVALRLLRDHWNDRCQPPWSEKELIHKVEDAYKEEPRRGWLLNEDRSGYKGKATTGGGASTAGQAAAEDPSKPPRDLALTSMSDMKATPVEWLAPGRIPLGKLVLLAGPGGLGKSTLTLDLAARLSRGVPLFDEQVDDVSDVEGPAEVLLVAAEDDAADTQLPRVLAAQGDVSKIHCVQGIRGSDGKIQPFSVSDIEPIHLTLLKRPNVRLVVIDPIAAYIGRAKVDDHRNSELSAILAPLNHLAAIHKVTFLLIAHFNKSTTASAVNRIMGGAAYVNSVRAALAIVPDPDDDDRRIVDTLKFNLAQKPKALAYRIGILGPDELTTVMEHEAFSELTEKQKNRMARQLAKIQWEGTVETSADECLGGSNKRGAPSKKADAVLWLHKYLAENGPKSKDQAIAAAKGQHGKNAIWEAWSTLRETLGAKPIPVEDETGKQVWLWPRLAPPAAEAKH